MAECVLLPLLDLRSGRGEGAVDLGAVSRHEVGPGDETDHRNRFLPADDIRLHYGQDVMGHSIYDSAIQVVEIDLLERDRLDGRLLCGLPSHDQISSSDDYRSSCDASAAILKGGVNDIAQSGRAALSRTKPLAVPSVAIPPRILAPGVAVWCGAPAPETGVPVSFPACWCSPGALMRPVSLPANRDVPARTFHRCPSCGAETAHVVSPAGPLVRRGSHLIPGSARVRIDG